MPIRRSEPFSFVVLLGVLACAADSRAARVPAREVERVEVSAPAANQVALEAALVAQEAGVKLLALTHVSTRYFAHQVVDEATQLFPATVVPRDFDLVTIPFPERGEPELVRSGARTGRTPADAGGTLAEPIL